MYHRGLSGILCSYRIENLLFLVKHFGRFASLSLGSWISSLVGVSVRGTGIFLQILGMCGGLGILLFESSLFPSFRSSGVDGRISFCRISEKMGVVVSELVVAYVRVVKLFGWIVC